MAILWQQTIDGNHYEVRTAGASVRLYRNSVNHSQWNPNRPLAGSIWDLITLPVLHRPIKSLKDVLILGFGAGAVGRQISELVMPERIVGVELDPIHLSIADGFFGCSKDFNLIAGDAVEWIHESDKKDSYDVIIDDLYAEEGDIPVRCVPMDIEWCESLARLLKPQGMLIFNIIEPDEIKHFPIFKSPKLKKRFTERLMYQIYGYENRIIAFSDTPFDLNCLGAQLKHIKRKYPSCRRVEERYVKSGNFKP